MPLKQRVAVVWFLVLAFHGSGLAADSPSIYFKTSPRIELLSPFSDPIDLSLLITGIDGKPVTSGSVTIRLDAPMPGRIFSTDFPLVEGTLLNEMRLPLIKGRANWKYLFPIRGEYRLSVEAVVADGSKASQSFVFTVRENRQKLWVLAGFSAALLVLGFVAGRIFTRTETAAILLIVSALALTPPAETHAPTQSSAGPSGVKIDEATVGKASLVRWSSAEFGLPNESRVFLTLSIRHLEKQKDVFAITKIPVVDEWSMKFHFPDGAGYRVSVIAEAPGRPSVNTEQVIAVTGVEPPAKAMIPALLYFVGLIALGLGAGRWSKCSSFS